MDGHAHRGGRSRQAAIIGRKANVEAALEQEIDRSEVERVEGAQGQGERLERAPQDER